MKKNIVVILTLSIAISVIIFDLFVDNEKGIKLSEVYVSLAAFVMLIGTSILQNIELSLQREDLNLTRKEMKMQTKEFEENNMQSKFFELLKSKEEIYMGIDRKDIEKFINTYKNYLFEEFTEKLQKDSDLIEIVPSVKDGYYLYDIIYNYRDPSITKKLNITEDDYESIDSCIHKVLFEAKESAKNVVTVPKDIEKLYKFKSIIEVMYPNNTMDNMFLTLKSPLKVQSLNYNQIYKGLLTDDEIKLYKIMDSKYELEDLKR